MTESLADGWQLIEGDSDVQSFFPWSKDLGRAVLARFELVNPQGAERFHDPADPNKLFYARAQHSESGEIKPTFPLRCKTVLTDGVVRVLICNGVGVKQTGA